MHQKILKEKTSLVRLVFFTQETRSLHVTLIFPSCDIMNYELSPIIVPSSAKHIATQILVIAKLNGRRDFILRGFICNIIRLSKELPVKS